MDINYFKETRILDGGMGQELLARGMKPNGTLWSANAILNSDYHKLLEDTHKDFVKAGAEVIVTTTFTTRRKRLRDNNVEDKFEYLNKKAGEIAANVKKEFPDIKIAGGLPPQHLTYEEDKRNGKEIIKDFMRDKESSSTRFKETTLERHELEEVSRQLKKEDTKFSIRNITNIEITETVNVQIETSDLQKINRERAKAIAKAIELNLIKAKLREDKKDD